MKLQFGPRQIPWYLIIIFLFLSIGIGLSGILYYQREKVNIRKQKEGELLAIADLKIKQIVNWRTERLGNANFFKGPPVAVRIREWLQNPSDSRLRQKAFVWMSLYRESLAYEAVFLVHPGKHLTLSAPEKKKLEWELVQPHIEEALRTDQIVFTDLHREPVTDHICMYIIIPKHLSEEGKDRPVACLILQIDPSRFLFPLVQSWPAPSQTSETLLVRRDGKEVVFLNELRHQKETALRLRFPAAKPRLPAAMAVQGKEGVIYGIDYRGVPVLAAVRKIPDSPWFLIAKIDEAELYAPIYKWAWMITILAGMLIMTAGIFAIHVWNLQSTRFYKKQYETELEKEALMKRFDYLSRYANDIIMLSDQDFNIVEVNNKALSVYGYSRDEFLRLNLKNLRLPELQLSIDELRQRLSRMDGSVYETVHQRKDSTTFPVEISAQMVVIEGKNYYQGIFRDISERKKAEEEKTALQEQLRQSQKMESIGQLAGGIAHEFNNLLSIMTGYCQVSLADLKPGDPLKENIEEIHTAAERAADLVRQLLAFSRRQIMELKVLDLNALIKNLNKMLKRLIGEPIEIITLLSEDLGRVKMDPGWIEQIIINLVLNAKDAMPQGGKLLIETANVTLDEPYAETHREVEPGSYVMLSISDTGTGMSREIKDKIFDPFFTTKEMGKGTGLGLSTVYGIVKQSGGHIGVYSEPGEGTIFKIYFPLVHQPPEEVQRKVPVEKSREGSETILVVEDDDEVRKFVVKALQRKGYAVLSAPNGEQALAVCKVRKDPIHLILTDVVMPGMSGPRMIEQCSQIRQDFKTLYMSGYTDNAIVHHGILMEGIQFIQKPIVIDQLWEKIRELLG